MYTRAKPVSRPSFHVLMNAMTLKTLWSMFSERFVNVSERFVNVLWTFLSVLWTLLNVSERFVNVFLPFCERFQNFSYRFVNVFRTFCQHFQNVLSTFYKHLWTSRKRFTFCKRLVKCLFDWTFCKHSHGAYFMHRWKAVDKTFPTTPHMMGYLIDLKNVPAGHIRVTVSISCVSLESSWEDISNDMSHEGLCT
jgi:hypothetical protein